jgi:hypothetical protein
MFLSFVFVTIFLAIFIGFVLQAYVKQLPNEDDFSTFENLKKPSEDPKGKK